ncbi:MAG: carbohydrate binding domain-containing protein [Armatimonadota bacterium]
MTKPTAWLGIIATLCSAIAVTAQDEQPTALPMTQITPQQTDAVLFNPGMGMYLPGGGGFREVPEDAWYLRDLADIVYFRPVWSDLEGAEGEYRFDEYFGPIFDFWVEKLGKRVAFRVMSESTHHRGRYATPEYVFGKGVPGVPHTNLYDVEQIDPVFWDPRYMDVYEKFLMALGQYLDGRKGLEFLDIGCIGEWGEMHLGLHMPGRWTRQQLEETGFTREAYILAYRRAIDAHVRAFPNTRIFLNVGDYDTIVDYAALRGVHFRQDGLKPSGPSANVGQRFYRPYSRRGVICNYEFHSGWNSMQQKGWGAMATVQKGLEDPISYMNCNMLGMSQLLDAPQEPTQALMHAARRVGFRFVIARLNYLDPFHLDGQRPGRILLQHTWQNLGVAPCYESYALRFYLVDARGNTVAEALDFPKTPTTLWWPQEEISLASVLSVPADTPPGHYTLKVAMVLPEQPDLRIQLGLAGREEDGGYALCQLTGVRAEPGESVTYQEGFEAGAVPWHATEGMTVALDPGAAHSGASSLLVSGTQAGAWNYASHTLQQPVLPASKYRLSGWMLVEQLEPTTRPPYLKIGLTDAEGEWLENHGTNVYDVDRLRTWQRLQVTFETTPNTAGGHLAIEKGGRELPVTVTLRLDDLKLELLERP